MSHEHSRVPLIDVFKAVAAQLIVFHHLAWYGPMSDRAIKLAPWLHGVQTWLADYGRLAVAVFFAIGGFLAARMLLSCGLMIDRPSRSPLCLVGQRYVRLVGPYAAALVLAIVSAALARQWMIHDSIGTAPDIGRVLAHLLLLNDLLDYEAISAGVWYVAIDFQLFALLVLVLWGAGRLPGRRFPRADILALALITLVALASLLFFNRDTAWDRTALYFFGAYALGVGSAWAVRSASPYRGLLWVALVGGLALSVDFRPRIAVALCVALTLGLADLHLRTSVPSLLKHLSRTSYALFLVHFSVCLLVSAVFHRFAPHNPLLNGIGVLLAWGASNVAAVLFYRHVEVRLANWQPRLPICRLPRVLSVNWVSRSA